MNEDFTRGLLSGLQEGIESIESMDWPSFLVGIERFGQLPAEGRLLPALDDVPLLILDAHEEACRTSEPITHTRSWSLIQAALTCARGAHSARIEELLDRAVQADISADRAVMSGERTVRNGLVDIVEQRVEDGFDPRGWFVYMLWGHAMIQPLYVGLSGNVLARLGSHLGDRNKRDHVARVTLLRCPSAIAMERTEARLITEYQPPWNTIGIRRDPD